MYLRILITIKIDRLQVLEVHRQIVAGTNFKMKLRLRNRVAPECRIDEVISSFLTLSLGSNIHCDGLKLNQHHDSAAFLMLVKKQILLKRIIFHSLSIAQVRVCEVVIFRPLPHTCKQVLRKYQNHYSSHMQTAFYKISISILIFTTPANRETDAFKFLNQQQSSVKARHFVLDNSATKCFVWIRE